MSKAASKSNKSVLSMDGVMRQPEQDQQISMNIAALFSSPAGKVTLEYLKSISINNVYGPDVSSDTLRHVEGQRYIVGVLEQRAKQGHAIKAGQSNKKVDKK